MTYVHTLCVEHELCTIEDCPHPDDHCGHCGRPDREHPVCEVFS